MLNIATLIITLSCPEILMSFSLNAVEYATVIVEAEVVDTSGRIRIEAEYRGHIDSTYLTFPELRSPKPWFVTSGFAADTNLVHQHCFLFLKEKDHKLVPAYSPGMGCSLAWVLGDSIYYGSQRVIPGPLEFRSHMTKKYMIDYIQLHNKSMFTLFTAKKCWDKEKVATLVESLKWTLLRDETINELSNSGALGVKALEGLLPNENYTYEHRNILTAWINAGGESVYPKVDSIFQHEFDYWKTALPTLRWEVSNFPPRYCYLSTLAYILALKHMPGWREKVTAIKELFQNEPAYQLPVGWGRIDTEMDDLLKRY